MERTSRYELLPNALDYDTVRFYYSVHIAHKDLLSKGAFKANFMCVYNNRIQS